MGTDADRPKTDTTSTLSRATMAGHFEMLENTIIVGNGQNECAITGIGIAFAGNLIQNNVADGTRFHREEFVGCGGVVTSSDAQLGPLYYNQGVTPTMAISAASPARNAADPVTSLTIDPRRQPDTRGLSLPGGFRITLRRGSRPRP